jgi:hypothetical protein
MKAFTHCPKCKNPLLNTLVKLRNGSEVWRKSCVNQVDHNFMSLTKMGDDDELSSMGLTLNFKTQIKITWDLNIKRIYVTKGDFKLLTNEGQQIPWFEPDVSNYSKLVEKLKTYVTFS